MAPGEFYGPAGRSHIRVALTATDERIDAAAGSPEDCRDSAHRPHLTTQTDLGSIQSTSAFLNFTLAEIWNAHSLEACSDFQAPATRGPRRSSPARPGVLSIWVASPDEPRPCLIADLVSRVAERHHLRAIVAGPAPADWDTLNVHPAAVTAGPPEPLDVAVAPADGPSGFPGAPDAAGRGPARGT